jgi:hypothetical protein
MSVLRQSLTVAHPSRDNPGRPIAHHAGVVVVVEVVKSFGSINALRGVSRPWPRRNS